MLSSPSRVFFGFCIPSRLAIAYVASRCVSVSCLLAFSGVAIVQAVSWLLIYTRVFPRDTGPETFGKQIWWNNLRPVHAVLHSLFAITSLYSVLYDNNDNGDGNSNTNINKRVNYGSLWLVLDACIGSIAHLLQHFFV